MTAKQKHFQLVAKLYGLAAEFTDAELVEIRQNPLGPARSEAVQQMIDALIRLHAESGESQRKSVTRDDGAKSKDVGQSAKISSLAHLLSDRDTFPSVADLARTLAIEVRPKESRDRYISRVLRSVDAMDVRDRAQFFDQISARLDMRPRSFISNWSKAIREM